MLNQKEKTTKQIILENLMPGADKAITRLQLVEITGLSDRAIRNIIIDLQDKEEIAICSYSSGKGYFYPSNEEEAQHALNEKKKRARMCFRGCRALQKYIDEQKQESLF